MARPISVKVAVAPLMALNAVEFVAGLLSNLYNTQVLLTNSLLILNSL